MQEAKPKTTAAIVANALIGVISLLVWAFAMYQKADASGLISDGFENLKYFTVLSNLFNGVVSLLYAVWLAQGREITVAKKTLKLVATAAVGLTFSVVAFFFGPLVGYGQLYTGSNLWYHLVLPLASAASFVFLERGTVVPFRSTFWVMVPPAVYAVGYVANIAVNGIGTWPHTNDFYGFLTWGNLVGAAIAALILLMVWVIALVLRRLGHAHR